MSGDDLDLLIHRYFEGALAPEDEERLRARLRTDPAAADRFVELSELESGLVETLKAEAEVPAVVRSMGRTSRRRMHRPAARPAWPFVAAAAIFLAALLLAVALVPKPPPREVVQRETPPETPVPPPVPDRPRDLPAPQPRETPPPTPPVRKPDLPRETLPVPPPKTEPRPTEKPAPPPPTLPVKATVALLDDTQPVLEGDTVEPKKPAVVTYSDGTRLELREETRLEEVTARGLVVRKGTVRASVARQAARFAFVTPHAEVTVLGTRFTISVAETTRVEVEEGRVRCRRLPDGATVEIGPGHFAVAGKGTTLASKLLTFVRTFQDGADYAGTRDAAIASASPTSNAGAAEQLRLHKSNENQGEALIRWDLSSIPPGSRILSAELTFWVTGAVSGPGFRVHEVRRPWEEGEVTWRTAGGGRAWQVAGAQGDGDRGTRVLAALGPTPTGFSTLALNEAGVALVQAWVTAPASNFGIVFVGTQLNNAWGLESRECTVPDRRPKLTLAYLPPGR